MGHDGERFEPGPGASPETLRRLTPPSVEADSGPIEVLVFNLGAQIGDRSLADTSYEAFELGWRLATFALYSAASAACPRMEARGLEHDGLLLPAEVANTYFHLSQQHRSAWTDELDLRSFSDRPWWNH